MGKVVVEEEEERQKWSNPIEFLLSCIAMSVRLLTNDLDTHVTVLKGSHPPENVAKLWTYFINTTKLTTKRQI